MLARELMLDEIVEVTGGALVDGPQKVGISGEETISSVSTDTRTLQPGALFVALRGPNHDGHAHIEEAAQKGANAFIVDKPLHDLTLPYIVVGDTTHALGDIARDVRDDFKGPVVGITGSVGKTTTKEMVAEILSANYTVLKSEANFNNEIGVPQTIFALEEKHTVLVVEMGMRGAGQIMRLAEIAAPTIGVITNVGVSHIELLGSQENIALAKAELFDLLPHDTGVAIFPANDAFAETLRAHVKCRALTVGVEFEGADVRATELVRHDNGWRFTLDSPWGRTKMFVPSPGRFNVQNALLAVAVGGTLDLPLDTIARALARWTPPPMRLETVTTARGVTVLSDAYNAAPDSMVGALETLAQTPVGEGGKRIAVLGEMRELGDYADEGHRVVGRAAAKSAPDMLILVGELTQKIASSARVMGFSQDKIHALDSTSQAAELVPSVVQAGDVVLVKGSRALGLEAVVNALAGNPTP